MQKAVFTSAASRTKPFRKKKTIAPKKLHFKHNQKILIDKL